jgi:DNA-binding MarR family transcriptional regulator
MPYQETSGLAYDSVIETVNKKQSQVLAVIEDHPSGMTNQEIAEYLGWPINTVTPRVYELVKKGWVEASGWRKGKTGRKCLVWAFVKD